MKKSKIVIICMAFSMSATTIFAQKAVNWKPNKDKQASILLFGDINIQNREKPEDAFNKVVPTLKNADFRIGNLEGPFAGTTKDARYVDIPHKNKWRHSEPDQIKGIIAANMSAVSVANNVTWPWEALMRSLAILEENDMPHAGGGENIEAAHKPVILEKNGIRIGFLAYASTVFPFKHAATDSTPGVATVKVDTWYKPVKNLDKPGMPMDVMTKVQPAELERMIADIKELNNKVDIVICSYHWGISHNPELIDYQVEIAHAAVDAGADVIMGHGNHLIAAIETYNGKPVFYGLGNFAFDWYEMKGRNEGLMAKLDIKNKKIDRVSLVPLWRDKDNNPYFLDPNINEGLDIYNNLQKLTGDLSNLTLDENEIMVEIK